jgi:nitroreductase
MEFTQVVQQRRAVRQYLASPVDKTVIKQLIDVATLAPSAMNLQPWAFAVVSGTSRIDEYARRAKEHLLLHANELRMPPEALQMLRRTDFNIFYQAPVLLLVLARSGDSQASEDCCLAAQTLMLAARDAGLGSCWIGLGRPWLDLPETKAELGLPREYHVIAPIVMGYPTAWPESHGRNAPEIHWLQAPGSQSHE